MICLPYRTDKLQMNYMRCYPTFKINTMEDKKLMDALKAYIEKEGYRTDKGVLLHYKKQYNTVEKAMILLNDLMY